MKQQLHHRLRGKPLLSLPPLSVSLLLSLVVVLHSVSCLAKSFDEESAFGQTRIPVYKQGRRQELKSPKDDKPTDELLMSLIEKYLKENSAAEKHHKLSSHKLDANRQGSESECGISDFEPKVDSRIVGGVEATPHSWPWQVRIIGTIVETGSQTLCGGSIFNSHWVITAAHCVTGEDPTAYKIVLGDHNMQDYEGTEQEIEIEDIRVHPEYDSNTVENDIALMRLPEDVEFNCYIKPICLPDDDDVEDGTRCVATGWGATQSTGDENVLNQVYLPVISNSQCNQPDWYNGVVKDSMICAGYPEGGKSPCFGDSGGPLACLSKGKWRLLGLSSWFIDESGDGRCALPRRPLVFTRVKSHSEWIRKNTEGDK